MNRRSFLQLFLTATVAAGIGVKPGLVQEPESSEKDGGYCLRYVELWDPIEARMMYRLDVSTGCRVEVPTHMERSRLYRNVRRDQILDVCDYMRKEILSIPPRNFLEDVITKHYPVDEKEPFMYGLSWG